MNTHPETTDPSTSWSKYCAPLREYIHGIALQMRCEAGGGLPYPFIVPVAPECTQYAGQLWDWDSWLSNLALRQVLAESGEPALAEEARPYEQGCILNFLHHTTMDGYMPVMMTHKYSGQKPDDILSASMHKPCLAQHAAMLVRDAGGDAEWLRKGFYSLQCYLGHYRNHRRHGCGIYFITSDSGAGPDNDPAFFGRPERSSGYLYLNCLMLRELDAAAYLADCLDQPAVGDHFRSDHADLLAALRKHCWDDWLGSYYSVDLNIRNGTQHFPPYPKEWGMSGWGPHYGQPCDWPCLIQRIETWVGFMALWSGLATREQAKRIVEEHYRNDDTLRCAAGVRTLSKQEKMFNVRASGNPSSWLGPVWIIANYMTWRGLVDYGFDDDALELAEKTVVLLGRDLERFGAFHEYYLPDNGEPVLNRGFLDWNLLVLAMIRWLEGQEPYREWGAPGAFTGPVSNEGE